MFNAFVPWLVRLGKCRNQLCVLLLYSMLLKGGLAFWTLNAKFTSEVNANVSTIPRVAVRLDATAHGFEFVQVQKFVQVQNFLHMWKFVPVWKFVQDQLSMAQRFHPSDIGYVSVKPHQLCNIFFPPRSFGKQCHVQFSFQSSWFAKCRWLHYDVAHVGDMLNKQASIEKNWE